MPGFDGENPDGWIMQAERYFACYDYDEINKIEAAFISFTGHALLWCQYENKKRPIMSWEELKRLVLKHFRDTQSGSLYDQFVSIRQEGSMAEYKKSFIRLLAPLDNVSPDIQLSTFLNGLTPSLRAEVRVHRPRSVDEAMELAQNVEEKLRTAASSRAKFYSSGRTTFSRGYIDNKDVVILIDPGATHNFISLDLVSLLKLPTTATDTYGVTMGNGESTKNEGICKGFMFSFKGWTFMTISCHLS
ncbi:hypothetical protein G4B88_009413 [Cannabis sativa]|uniref:Retrotransposon gag domain-containing protein n=1 Tax=Cannabis sativa TaxID=3483 RepID=A0A7J6GGU7_CANSA|nr:hypothetical protein G4B88_009413 [Cannabis sativa]